MKKNAIVLIVMVTAQVVLAHPGHGNENPLSPGHYVNNPEHSAPIMVAIAAAVFLIHWMLTRLSRKSLKK